MWMSSSLTHIPKTRSGSVSERAPLQSFYVKRTLIVSPKKR